MPATRLAGRILARLAQAEACESNPHYRDDLRIARLTVAYAASGEAVLCSPDVLASYTVLGLHPRKVWPAIQARRKALGLCEETGAPPVPKKPAQSVKLWYENRNGARAANSRAGGTVDLRDQTISVPMAAPSIAALYPNPDRQSSVKTHQFTYQELLLLVQFSGAPGSVKAGTISALLARGPWPKEDGPATPEICISLLGMMLDGTCCRRTAQRRVKRACDLGFWRRTRNLNSWLPCVKCGTERKSAKCPNAQCGHVGRSRDLKEFRRPFTYEIDIEKFRTAPRPKEIRHFDARTYAEYKAAAKRGEHPNVREWPTGKPPENTPPPKAPAPARPEEPRRKTAEHQATARRADPPKLSKTEAAKFVAHVEELKRGRTRHVESVGGYGYQLEKSDPRYRAPMSQAEAMAVVSKAWNRSLEFVLDSLRFYGYHIEGEAESPPRDDG